MDHSDIDPSSFLFMIFTDLTIDCGLFFMSTFKKKKKQEIFEGGERQPKLY